MVKNFDIALNTPISCSNRSFKICQLDNGIMALVISDPAETIASFSLSVASGSHNDPNDIAGLAHLCEHAILASGSKEFPKRHQYHETIVQNGGSHNAYTSGENTTYYFELPVSSDKGELVFERVLEILSSSLKNPVFTETTITKEIYTIESEHGANKASQNKQLYHATRLLASKSHPFSRFCTGNFETLCNLPKLRKLSLKNSLMAYFNEFYRPSNMAICIKSSQSLNLLTKLAIQFFGGISGEHRHSCASNLSAKGRGSSSRSSEVVGTTSQLRSKILKRVWLPKYQGSKIFDSAANFLLIKASKGPTMRLIFPINHKYARFSVNNLAIFSKNWCDIFGDESVGSLADCLRKLNLVTSITSSCPSYCSGEDGLVLELSLTRDGSRDAHKILQTIFDQYIPKFIHDQTRNLAMYLSDLNAIDMLKFLYQSRETSSMEMCAEYSTRMLSDLEALDPKCLLKGCPLPECNDPSTNLGSYHDSSESIVWWTGQAIMFQNFISDFVNRQNMRIIILGDQGASGLLDPLSNPLILSYDPYYEFEYFKGLLDFAYLDQQANLPDFPFHIPNYDCFLPSVGRKLEVIKRALEVSSARAQDAALSFVTHENLVAGIPRLVCKNRHCEMWVKEEEFNLSFKSKSMVSFEVISRMLHASPYHTISLEILGELLSATLSGALYPSEKIGFTYEIFPSVKGDVRLGFTITGFPEGVYTIIRLITDTIKDLAYGDRISPALFRQARVAVRNKYERAASGNCTVLATLGLLVVLEECMWPMEDRLEALEEIDLSSFLLICSQYLGGPVYLNLLIQGDLDYADAIKDWLMLQLVSQSTPKNEYIIAEPASTVLDQGTNAFIKKQGPLEDPNNCIVYFIQTGARDNAHIFALTSFTAFLMSLTLVPDLRIKRQIGYVVFGGMRLLSTTVGIHVTCMSDATPEHLEVQIDEYLTHLELDVLQNMSENEFQDSFLRKFCRISQGSAGIKSQSSSGPSDISAQIKASVQSGNLSEQGKEMLDHKRMFSQISTRRYNFEVEDEPLDAKFLEGLTLQDYRHFFRGTISVFSERRSKLSIMVESTMGLEEISKKRLCSQVGGYLKVKGLKISNRDLEGIIEKAGGRPQSLLKELIKYFASKGETLKLCNIALKESLKAVISAVVQKVSYMHPEELPAITKKNYSKIPLTQIHNVNEYRLRRKL
ncbi:LADA_0H07470g1_1 [Lachancea dasiensis]|uniref:LADA_0H07470g1_1 n=1 Tax=Lachancea dasiensis TaxID=1072105 RepID=A0A1G4K246_9SACH|nr:LADA_0H07470g1_1 [Lachancea dasiensis]